MAVEISVQVRGKLPQVLNLLLVGVEERLERLRAGHRGCGDFAQVAFHPQLPPQCLLEFTAGLLKLSAKGAVAGAETQAAESFEIL